MPNTTYQAGAERTPRPEKDWVPLAVGLGLLWVSVAVLLTVGCARSSGHFGYALDDPYIHMAMARNLAFHGVWGVTPDGFSGTSSSPLYTLLLAGLFRLLGPVEVLPLVLNLVFGTLLVVRSDALLRREGASVGLRSAALAAVVCLSPLPTLVLTGMEHTLQAWLVLEVVDAATQLLGRGEGSSSGAGRLAALCALSTATRFEGLFVAFLVCLLFLARRRRREAVLAGAGALAPVVIYGLVSLSRGWYFLPNSVVLKGSGPDPGLGGLVKFLFGFTAAGPVGVRLLLATGYLHVPAFLALVYYFILERRRGPWDPVGLRLVLFLGTLLLHVQFGRLGWMYRYEAYLLTLAFVVLAAAAAQAPLPRPDLRLPGSAPTVAMALIAAFLMLLPFVKRAAAAYADTPAAISLIYRQQHQMARFLSRYYSGRPVAVSDIGEVTYRADTRLLDLFGLASLDVARAKRTGSYSPAAMANLVRQHGVEVAIVTGGMLDPNGGPPREWIKVGEWRYPGSVIFDRLSFFAPDEMRAKRLEEHLREFDPELPSGVVRTVFGAPDEPNTEAPAVPSTVSEPGGSRP